MQLEEKKRNRLAVSLLLAGLAVQIGGAFVLSNLAVSPRALQLVMLLFFALSAAGLYLLRCPIGCAGGAAGAVVCLLAMLEVLPANALLTNVLHLVLYLPAQSSLDRSLEQYHSSALTRTLGRRWMWTLVIGRVVSCGAVVMPLFAGAEQASIAQNQLTLAFYVLLALEVIALVATVISYVYQVRYLWRARGVFSE